MVFYDYSKIWVVSGGDSNLILHYFNVVVFKRKGYEFLVGDNFMVNEEVVTLNRYRLSSKMLAEYIGLCSLRPYTALKYHNIVDLSLELFPDYIPKQVVNTNKLVKLEGKWLRFTKEKKHGNRPTKPLPYSL